MARAELLQRELQEAVEAKEPQAKLDAITKDNLNVDGKENTMFSKVNDRQERVENQLNVNDKRYEVLKNNYDVKMAELQMTKMHNNKLLSIAGSSHSDTRAFSKDSTPWRSSASRRSILGPCCYRRPRVTGTATCPASWPPQRGAARNSSDRASRSTRFREMTRTRKVNQLKTSTQKLKLQSYTTLKIDINKLICKKGEQKK